MTKVTQSRLTYIKRTVGGRVPKAIYSCICGNTKEIRESSVNAGVTKSCGCLLAEQRPPSTTTHGLSKHPIYRVWNGMKDRCYREKSDDYPDYGGRGVIVCDEWKDDFMAFYNWAICNGWKKGLQIDKDLKAKEMNLPAPLIYSPEWCRFVTPADNSNGRRSNRVIEYKGERRSLSEWSKLIGLNRITLRGRLERNGWVLDDAIFARQILRKMEKHENLK